jgi:hypothetical protein
MTEQNDSLKRVAALAGLMREQASTVTRLEAELAAAKTAFQRTEQEDLPELLAEVELSSVTLDDGTVVEVVPDVQCGISEERKPEAHAWLESHEFGGLIKTSLIITFDREEREQALDVAAKIEETFERFVELKEGVNAQTLKSFIKERMADAAEKPEHVPPFDVFGIRPFNRAKLKVSTKAVVKKALAKAAAAKAAKTK